MLHFYKELPVTPACSALPSRTVVISKLPDGFLADRTSVTVKLMV